MFENVSLIGALREFVDFVRRFFVVTFYTTVRLSCYNKVKGLYLLEAYASIVVRLNRTWVTLTKSEYFRNSYIIKMKHITRIFFFLRFGLVLAH